jgi:hypothetical protein
MFLQRGQPFDPFPKLQFLAMAPFNNKNAGAGREIIELFGNFSFRTTSLKNRIFAGPALKKPWPEKMQDLERTNKVLEQVE